MECCSRCKRRSPIEGRRWCLECASYMRNARRKYREKNKDKEAGICSRTDCKNPAELGLKSCSSCRQREKSYEEQRYERIQFNQRQTRRKKRMRVFNAYGGPVCACCGVDHYEFLTIDHIDGKGANHRKEIGREDIYRWLERNSFPKGFRVLCMNCNFALGSHGYCPHHGWTQYSSNGLKGKPPNRKRMS